MNIKSTGIKSGQSVGEAHAEAVARATETGASALDGQAMGLRSAVRSAGADAHTRSALTSLLLEDREQFRSTVLNGPAINGFPVIEISDTVYMPVGYGEHKQFDSLDSAKAWVEDLDEDTRAAYLRQIREIATGKAQLFRPDPLGLFDKRAVEEILGLAHQEGQAGDLTKALTTLMASESRGHRVHESLITRGAEAMRRWLEPQASVEGSLPVVVLTGYGYGPDPEQIYCGFAENKLERSRLAENIRHHEKEGRFVRVLVPMEQYDPRKVAAVEERFRPEGPVGAVSLSAEEGLKTIERLGDFADANPSKQCKRAQRIYSKLLGIDGQDNLIKHYRGDLEHDLEALNAYAAPGAHLVWIERECGTWLSEAGVPYSAASVCLRDRVSGRSTEATRAYEVVVGEETDQIRELSLQDALHLAVLGATAETRGE